MIRTVILTIALFFLAAILIGCQPPASVPDTTDLSLLVVADGDIQLKRENWSDYFPTMFGTELHRGDLLQVAPGGKAVVLCDSLTTRSIPTGQPFGLTNECPQANDPALARSRGAIGNTRGGNDPLIPYIISPRMTRLLTDQPVLQWNKVAGVITYTVRIKGEGLAWSTETTATQVAYTGTETFKPGTTYLLVVTTDNGKSSQNEAAVGLGFSVLNDQEAAPIKTENQQLMQLDLPADARSFAQAQLYAGHGLVAEATQLLENLVATGRQEPAIYRLLGDLYRQIGLNRLAEERYSRALELAKRENDLEGQALTLNGLGLTYEALGNKDQAQQQARAAIEIYQRLGDAKSVKQIEDRLAGTP